VRGEKPAPDAFLNRGFAFQAPVWAQSGLRQTVLTKARGGPLPGDRRATGSI
jgi:hypothetical protein